LNEVARRRALGIAIVVLGLSVGLAMWAGPRRAAPVGGDMERMETVLTRGPEELETVLMEVFAIEDPVVRQAAVVEWLRRNQAAIDPRAAGRLCHLLDGVAVDLCLRRAESPHLRSAPQ
jgi:hypothetical protein